jgi:hypothetical protein
MLKYILLLIAPLSFGAIVDGEGIATLVEGDTKVFNGLTLSNLDKGSVFKAGNNLKTGDKSKAELFLSNGIRLVMLPNSSLVVKTLKQEEGSFIKPNPENKSVKESSPSITDFEVESGKVIGDVKKLAPMSVFTMKTPVGVVKIKGTVFSVEYKVNKDGTASFNVGCLAGRVVVEMADPRIPPVNVPAGKQMAVSAPQPSAVQSGGDKPPQGGEGPKGNAPPPPPPMQVEVKSIPPVEMKEMSVRMDMPPPPPPPPPPSPNGPAQGQPPAALDRIMQEVSQQVMEKQVDPSPTGG